MAHDVRFYYYRDQCNDDCAQPCRRHHRPLITLCRVVADDGCTGYGWSICGPRDNPHATTILAHTDGKWRVEPGGREIAKGRALRALKRGLATCDGAVRVYAREVRRAEARMVMQACEAFGFRALVDECRTDALPQSMQPPRGKLHVTR